MTTFIMLPALLRSLFALYALLLCLINIGSGVLAAVKKHLSFVVFALLLFAPSYFLWQVIFDYSLIGKTSRVSTVTERLIALPVVAFFIAFGVLTLVSVLLFVRNIRFDRSFITPGTIKLYLDKVPCGVCCWRKNGRVLFSNVCMNELCIAVCASPLLNGNQFHDAVKGGILTVGDKVWRFVCNEIELDGETLWEMIATDITNEHSKTEALKKDNEHILQLNKEMQEYYMSIDESVKRREILQAKMNIHDEMNRLMLATVSCGKNDTEALDKAFSLWEQNALLLCMEADKKKESHQSERLEALAKSLGIKLIFEDVLTAELTDKQKELFFATAQEALINAVKHADARNMAISHMQEGATHIFRFTNDGRMPEKEIRFEGGLANIDSLAKKQGASLYAELSNRFTLILKLHMAK